MIPSASAPDPAMEALRWPAHDGFYRPAHDRGLTGVFPTLFSLLGRAVDGYPSLARWLPPGTPRAMRRALLLCVDALGFKELAQTRRLQALYPEYGTWITSVFPSITSCALSSLYQALPPARHGIAGHVIWKDFPGALVDMLRMQVPGAREPLAASGFDVNRWKREPGFLETPQGAALPGYQLMNRRIVGSGLSNLIYGRTPLVGYLDLLEGFTKAARILSELEHGWVGLYLEDVDTLGHVLSGDAPQLGLLLAHLEASLAWMAGSLSPAVAEETLLLVVADHGQSTIRERLPLYGENLAWLERHTRAVGNSGRVLHVYLKPPQQARVRPWLEEFVGARGRVFDFEEVAHLAGPPMGDGADPAHASWLRQSLGDLVVLLERGCNWERHDPAQPQPPYESRLVSQHGSLSWDEMFVPLLAAPLAALRVG
jgi:hypothetical protein